MDVAERSLPDGPAAAPIDASSDLRGFGKPRRSRGSLQRVKRRAWRMGLRARFLLFQRNRLDKPVIETVAGRPILVLPEVLNPKIFLTGEFLAETLCTPDPSGLRPEGSGVTVLDMGTGSGVGAVFAAQWAGRVVAVDISPAAVRCARINALLNHVEDRVDVVEGDLFEPVAGKRFDVILFNPPYFQGQPRTNFEGALWSYGLHDRFAEGLAGHLNHNGCALLLLSSTGQEITWLQALQNRGFDVAVVAQKRLPGETLTLYHSSGGG